ncbi:MAG: FMN-binding protein [Prevotella sp.]|jgi:uncharacterized protein with FMN-binding domain
MKRKTMIKSTVAVLAVVFFISAMPADSVISKDGATTIVNTTTLTKNIRGYKSTTPVKIYIKKNRVVKVEALKTRETPKYFAKAKAVLDNFSGKTVTKAEKMSVDAVSGATVSSKALVKNVQTGLKYYKAHK